MCLVAGSERRSESLAFRRSKKILKLPVDDRVSFRHTAYLSGEKGIVSDSQKEEPVMVVKIPEHIEEPPRRDGSLCFA